MLTYDDLHDYQRRAIAHAFKMKQGYWFLDTGMGKTVLALAVHDQLKKRNEIEQSLVIAPLRVMNNVWRQEAKKWDFSKDFTFERIHGKSYRGGAEQSKETAYIRRADFHLINYEGLQWLSERILHTINKGEDLDWQCVFYDESTHMKRASTKRFKAFKQFMRKFKYRFCLTGTPIPNRLEDIFGQAYCVDQGIALGKTITSFRKKYMLPLYPINDRVIIYGPRDGAKKEIAMKISSKTIRLKKTEHLDLPELNYDPVRIPLSPALLESYKELEREYFIEWDGQDIETFSAAGTSMKLRQFLQGRIYKPDHTTIYMHDLKAKILRQLKLDGNTIIAYNFRYERKDIEKALKVGTRTNLPFLDAETNTGDDEKYITEWNNYEHKFFLVNPASAAYGLNLQAGGNNIVWYSLTWNAEHYSQLIDRLWRQGQRKTVNVRPIIFENTIDEAIAKALQRKDSDQQGLMNDIVRYKETKL